MTNDFISKDARYRSWTKNGGFYGHLFWIEGNNTNPPFKFNTHYILDEYSGDNVKKEWVIFYSRKEKYVIIKFEVNLREVKQTTVQWENDKFDNTQRYLVAM